MAIDMGMIVCSGAADGLLRYWLWLGALAGIDAKRANRLLEAFGNPYEVFRQRRDSLAKLEFMNDKLLGQLMDLRAREGIDEKIASLAEKGIRIISKDNSIYPKLILEIEDPPPVLFMRGSRPPAAADIPIAVVGTRHPTAYGILMTKKIVSGLASFGCAIVSGLAMGVDAAAHKAAMDAGAKTYAFLGCGVDRAYPASNWRLMNEVMDGGAVYSEYLPGAVPYQQNFPQRNRLISGMSVGVVVIEAGERSGALITARYAGEQGRDVFAVPGNVTSPMSVGANALLRDGAILAASAEDIVCSANRFLTSSDAGHIQTSMLDDDDYGRDCAAVPSQSSAPTARRPPNFSQRSDAAARRPGTPARPETRKKPAKPLDALNEPEKRIVKLLRGQGPADADAIASQCKVPAPDAAALLVMLEIKGFLQKLPGGVYVCTD